MSERSNAPEGWWREFIAADPPRTAKVGLTAASGQPLVAPVWVALDGDDILFNTGIGTAKGRALARDPRIALCFDDERPPFSVVMIHGRAQLIDDLPEVRKWAGIIGGRYMGADRADEFGDRNGVPGELLVRVTPLKVMAERDLAN